MLAIWQSLRDEQSCEFGCHPRLPHLGPGWVSIVTFVVLLGLFTTCCYVMAPNESPSWGCNRGVTVFAFFFGWCRLHLARSGRDGFQYSLFGAH